MTGVALVVAVSKNGVIGVGGTLPWRISDDLKWFKEVTMGKPVVMGRKTYESIGKPLSGRANIVVTRAHNWRADGVIRAGSVEEAIRRAAFQAEQTGAEEICVIGGGEIYAQTIDIATRLYLTEVDVEIEGGVYFPPIRARDWRRSRVGGCDRSDKNQHSCEFFILDRNSAGD